MTNKHMEKNGKVVLRNAVKYYAGGANAALDGAVFSRLFSEDLVNDAVPNHPQ